MRTRMLVLAALLASSFLVSSPAQAAATYRGDGDDVVDVPNTTKPGIAQIVYDGDGYFSVWGLDAKGKETQLLANRAGAYDGTEAFNIDRGDKLAALKVSADGPWTIRLLPLSKARSWSITTRGTDNDVLRLSKASAGFRKLAIRYTGDGYFSVWALNSSGRRVDLLANKAGAYKGTVPLPAGTRYAVVTADDAWSIVRK